MQSLISRFGGTPALILKLLFLGVINGMAIWALPQMITSGAWVMLLVLVGSTLALDFLMLTKRFIPAKYVVIGAILLLVFQLIPIAYTVSIAFLPSVPIASSHLWVPSAEGLSNTTLGTTT